MKRDDFVAPWKKVAENWEKYYTPPGRPSPEDIETYTDYVKRALVGKSNARSLVLGATPEIRNLLHKFPVEVTILDANNEMVLAMNGAVKDWQKDKVVVGDWVKNDLPEHYFDLVLGDLTWGNVPRDQWTEFHTKIVGILKPGGYYIQRVTMIPDGWQFQTTEETLKQFSRLSYTPQRHFELFFRLLTDTYDQKTHTMSWNKVAENLLPWWRNGKIVAGVGLPGIEKLLTRLFGFWGQSSKSWQTDYPGVLRSDIGRYFTILEEKTSSDYLFSETSPFWFCQVKNK